jgi:hypothetical protein
MAKHKKGKRGDDVITIGKEDWKGSGGYKAAPGGKYRFRFNKKSSIKPGQSGNILNLMITITAMHNGKKTEHKGVNVFDNIAPHVGWKIAQLLKALGYKKAPKKMTLKELLAIIKKYDKEFRAIIGTRMYNGKKQNHVIQYLPLEATKDEDDDDIEDDDDLDEDDDDSDDDDSDDDDDDDDADDEDDEDEDEDEDDEEDEDEDEDDEDEDEDEDDEDDEDDEEEERPRRKSKKAKKKAKKR